MTNNPPLSVIVPNYNNSRYIDECIGSVLAQTYKNIEIIIIDDASTDGSQEILKKYEAEYPFIKVIFNEKNQGVTRNRDTAIRLASGDYITTLDSDDYYMDARKLEKEMTILKKYRNEGRSNIIAFSDIVLVDKEGERLFPNAKNTVKEGNIFKNIFARDCMVPRDFIFTKQQYFDTGGFDIDIPIYEDWDLKLRLAKHNAFYFTGVEGIGYRRHGEGLSAANNNKHVKWLKYIYKKNSGLIDKEDKAYIDKALDRFMQKAFAGSIKTKLKDKIKTLIGRK
ncbi:glycosyltransferase family 2 protein [Sulfurovum lithotrophicum]|uniref:glycosyltransferase family 2 protein n=1 Tax=Sulfurovum lithotrophicum TaxID=206403 RepID=UPI000697F622|nr:glycosyltransferase [Sulfurovum lithotrophicum]